MAEDELVVQVMAEYDSFPLWLRGPGGTDNIDPKELQLSPQLCLALMTWAESYDSTLNRQDPGSSDFPDAAAEERFYAHGAELAYRVAAELDARYGVTYFDGRIGSTRRVT